MSRRGIYFFVDLKVNTTDMALPGNLSYFLSRMQGVSTNYFKIFPNNTGTATPSKILRFELPSNSLLNLRSLQLMFSASTTGATAGGRLPNKIDSLIERYALVGCSCRMATISTMSYVTPRTSYRATSVPV